jgi:hypothetical protein
MDRRPTLETRPPVLIDAVVRMLIPPPCREHVVGDLWERYRSPLGYVLDAARTVPFVIVSQIRRTSRPGLVVLNAFVFFVAFGAASGGLRRASVPVVAAVLGLVLRDAYKSTVSLSVGQVARDVAVGVVCVGISQLLLTLTWPYLLLPPRGVLAAVASFGMAFLLRLQNPGLGNQPRQALLAAPASLEALVTEVRLYERVTLRAVRIEMWAGVTIACAFMIPIRFSTNVVLQVGWGLISVYALYVAYVMWREKPRRMPDGLRMSESASFYRAALERKHEAVRTMWRWYLLPIVPGMFFVLLGSAIAAVERGRPAWPAARSLQLRIDAMKALEER